MRNRVWEAYDPARSGTDSGPSIHGTALGAAVHLEMSLYVQHCGFSPVEALQSATSVAAKRLRLKIAGSLHLGKGRIFSLFVAILRIILMIL